MVLKGLLKYWVDSQSGCCKHIPDKKFTKTQHEFEIIKTLENSYLPPYYHWFLKWQGRGGKPRTRAKLGTGQAKGKRP